MGCKCSKRLARYVSNPKRKSAAGGSGPELGVNESSDQASHSEQDAETDAIAPIDVKVDYEAGREAASQAAESRQHWRRREEERAIIKQYDTAEAETFYLIDLTWLSEWRNFAFKEGPIPGPIDNSRLVDPQTGVAQSGLALKDDYRGVNQALWDFWHERYGGGPAVPRTSLDLYSPEPHIDSPQDKQVDVKAPEIKPLSRKPEEKVLGAMHKFPLRLGFAAQAAARMASKGLAGSNTSEPLDTSQYPDNTVFVNIYDLGNDDLGKMINKVSTLNDAVMVGGVFHAGIEIYGYEWSFGRIEVGSGVWRTLPRMEMGHQYRATMPLGSTKLSSMQVWEVLQRMGNEWPGLSYDLLRRNCLSFCNAFCEELGVRQIPGWVDRAPRAASAVLDTTNMLGCTGRDK